MSTTAGGKLGGNPTRAGNSTAITRSLVVNGNRIDSGELFATEREIMIVHGEETYRLRLTSQNKLILTK